VPTYLYVCPSCAKRIEDVRRIAERDDCPKCTRCYGATERRITATMVSVFTPYQAVAEDKDSGRRPMIKSRAEHEAFLRRNGYEEVGNDKSCAPPSAEEVAARRAEMRTEEIAFDLNTETHEAQLETTP
jgi:putative FmdB family regulatory protein